MRRYFRTVFSILSAGFTSIAAAQPDPTTVQPAERLGDFPPAPARTESRSAAKSGQTSFAPGFLNITSRETSRQFFNTVFGASENVPIDWSGSYATGNPGTNSTEYLRAVLRRVNYFRAMAGVPASVTFDAEFTRKAQAAALMMGGNNAISHNPPPTWLYYTADGAEAAEKSNLALGNAGPDAVLALMRDNQANNAAVGHRRWILYPQTQLMGSGNVPKVGPSNSAAALWILDSHFSDPTPPTRNGFVSWPPPGFVPYQLAFARWSFTYPEADFTQATVSMTSNNVPLSIALEPITTGAGDNTLVWVPAGLNSDNLVSFARPSSDTVYHVTLSNVLIDRMPQSFAYDVIVFDPAVPGADFVPATISGPAQPLAFANSIYSFPAVTNANSYEWRQSRTTNAAFFDGAENGLTNFIVEAATNLYSVITNQAAVNGTRSFHLTHTQAVNQILEVNRLFVAASNSTVRFHSRLGFATSVQIAKVQVSLDEGNSWSDEYVQPGSGGMGESGFTLRTVPLGKFAGRSFRVRMNYELGLSAYFPQATAGVGWYIDNFTVTNCQQVVSSTIAPANANQTFGFTPTNTGSYLLEVRPVLFGDYPGEWGPGFTATALPNTNVIVRITSIQNVSGNTWHINFVRQNGNATAFELWSAASLPATFAKETTATIQTIVAGSSYRAVVTSIGPQRFFQIKPL